MLEYIANVITRLPMERLGQNLGGRIPSCPGHVCRDAVVMVTVIALQPCMKHLAVMGDWKPKA